MCAWRADVIACLAYLRARVLHFLGVLACFIFLRAHMAYCLCAKLKKSKKIAKTEKLNYKYYDIEEFGFY